MQSVTRSQWEEMDPEDRADIEFITKAIVLELISAQNTLNCGNVSDSIFHGRPSCISEFRFDEASFMSGRLWYVDDRLETREVKWLLRKNSDPSACLDYACEFTHVPI